MTKTLEMTFRTEQGKEVVLNLPNPKDGITLAEVQTVMNSILSKNIFTTKTGNLAQVVDAKLRVLDVTPLA